MSGAVRVVDRVADMSDWNQGTFQSGYIPSWNPTTNQFEGKPAFALSNVGTPGVYGDTTHYPIITTDPQGRVTQVTLQALPPIPPPPVTSVFGQVGDILAKTGDYTGIAQGGGSVQVNSDSSVTVTGVTKVNAGVLPANPVVFTVNAGQNASFGAFDLFTIDAQGGVYFRTFTGTTWFHADTLSSVVTFPGMIVQFTDLTVTDKVNARILAGYIWGATHQLQMDNSGTVVLLPLLSPSDKGLVIQGAPTQFANLLELQNSSAFVAAFDSGGNLFIGSGTNINTIGLSSGICLAGNLEVGGITFFHGNLLFAANTILSLTGTTSTAPLLRFSTNTDTASRFTLDASGTLIWGSGSAADDTRLQRVGTGQLRITNSLVIQGAPTQSANLQEWQDSYGNVLSAINAAGGFTGAIAESQIVNLPADLASKAPLVTPLFEGKVGLDVVNAVGSRWLEFTSSSQANLYGYWELQAATVRFSGGPGFNLFFNTNASGRIGFSQGTLFTPTGLVEIRSTSNMDALVIDQGNAPGATWLAFHTDNGNNHYGHFEVQANAVNLVSDLANGHILLTPTGTGCAGIGGSLSGTQFFVQLPDPGKRGMVVQGAPAQSANLQEWQDSNGLLLVGFQADGNMRTSKAVAATTPGSIVKKLPLYDAAGLLLGYLPLYNTIT